MQFYNTVGDLHEGLKILRRADVLKFDPWVQSAEVAASTVLNVGSRAARKNMFDLKSGLVVPRRFSELAMAMATLDRANGVKERKVFQLVKAGLPNATENGFAQAIWLSNRSSREFSNRFPEARPSEEAYEAKVDLAIRTREFSDAAIFAELWVADQPFSIDALIGFLNLHSIHVKPNAESKRIALRAVNIHAENWHVLNACVLLLSEVADFKNAHLALAKLERSAPDNDNASPYVAAAAGYLAFAEGNFFLGRLQYDEAIKRAKRAKNQYSVINAFIFWFRAEAINKLLSQGCVNDITKRIEKALNHLHHLDKRFLEDAWHSIKARVLSSQCENKPMEADSIFDNAASYIDEPLLINETPFHE